MHLTYHITPEDFRKFVDYSYHRSPTLRKHRMRSLILSALAMLAVYLVFLRGKSLAIALIFAAFAILYLFLVDIWTRRSYLKNSERMYREREKGAETRGSTLTLTETGIIAVSKNIEAEFKWEVINRIVNFEDRAYLFVNPLDAIIIPREGVEEGDYDAFIAAVKGRTSQP